MIGDDAFVRRRALQFEIAGRPYHFAGFNFWYAAYLGRPGREADRARLRRELDRLQGLGVTNLRVLAASEPTAHSPLDEAFQPRPGEYNEHLLQGLDYFLDQARLRGLYAVLYLNNQWEWSGGMATYVEWITGDTRPPADRWPDTLRFDARFFGLPAARARALAYVRHVVTRVNTVNGRAYADDPTIMTWQLANEPRAGDAGDLPAIGPHLLAWADETSRLIRQLAPRQLISTGSEGTVGCGHDRDYCRALHALPAIDYLTAHIWPYNWFWYRPAEAAATLPDSLAKTREYLDVHVGLARELNKPLVLEEFGLPRDEGRLAPGTPTTARDAYLRFVIDYFHHGLGAGSPLAGLNLWSWAGEAVPVTPAGAKWQPGQPLCGDNGNEPQGLNSIYSSDQSTLELIWALNRTLAPRAAPAVSFP